MIYIYQMKKDVAIKDNAVFTSSLSFPRCEEKMEFKDEMVITNLVQQKNILINST